EPGAIQHGTGLDTACSGFEMPVRAVEMPAGHRGVEARLGTVLQRLSEIGERRRPRVDDVLAWHEDSGPQSSRKMRLARQGFFTGQPADVTDAIGAGKRNDGVESGFLLVRPGDHHGTGL